MVLNTTLRTPFRNALMIGCWLALTSAALLPVAAEARPRTPTNRSMESVHQPVVSYTNFAYDVQVGGSTILSPGETQRLEGWLASINLGYGDRVSVGSNGAYYGAGAANDIANLIARHGLLLEEDAELASAAPEGAIRLVVRRATASVPGCPNWSDKQEANGIGGISRNYGCATNGNLAAMIANPEDLIHGQSTDSALRTATSNRAIQVHRDKIPTGSGGLQAITAGGN